MRLSLIKSDVPGRGPERLRFFGLCMSQNQNALALFSAIFDDYGPFAQLIEIGTGNGGLSILFHIYAASVRGRFLTIDNRLRNARLLASLGVESYGDSCWNRENDLGAVIVQPGRSFIFCDGGDKRRELATFARYLKMGDIIGVHDYAATRKFYQEHLRNNVWDWCEITWNDIEPIANTYNLQPIERQFCEASAIMMLKKN